jgi:diguanylate cyclase (GGDEF)-like protein/PAS domain S-box-containing protein
VGFVEEWKPENNLLWVANGLLLAYLLLAPRRHLPAYLAAGLLGLCVRIPFNREMSSEFMLYNFLDVIEVGTGALLLRRRSMEVPRFTDRAYLIRFLAYAVLTGPALAGAFYQVLLPVLHIPGPPHPFTNWLVSDSLGIIICTPAFVAVFQRRLRRAVPWRKNWFYPVLLMCVTFAAFAQGEVPLGFLIYPLLVLVLVRVGLAYASMSTLMVAGIVGWLTIHKFGLFAEARVISPAMPALLLQLAIASAVFLIYVVSIVLESERATEAKLQQALSLHELVANNSRDVIMLIDFNGVPRYISPGVFGLMGWKPDETMDKGFIDMVHPDDLEMMQAVTKQVRSGSECNAVEYRIRRRNGSYVWVEGSLKAVRDGQSAACTGLLQITRDISERKRAQEQLQEAYRSVEKMAAIDGLTGVANRRRFDEALLTEWRRGLRDHSPLSMVMMDVDHFKAYNDTYGHLRGDSCLKQVAESAMDVVTRAGDLVSRYGGEEFAIILPNTELEGAIQIAEEIGAALRGRKLPHSASAMGIVSVSSGCATLVPKFGQHAIQLIDMADQAMYLAKCRGRNRVCAFEETERPGLRG